MNWDDERRRKAIEILATLPEHFDAEAIAEDWTRCPVNILLSQDGDAFIAWADVGKGRREIEQMAVRSCRRGAGLGAKLLRDFMEMSRVGGTAEVLVSTFAAHSNNRSFDGARAFYLANGFRQVAVEEGCFNEGTEPAAHLARAL